MAQPKTTAAMAKKAEDGPNNPFSPMVTIFSITPVKPQRIVVSDCARVKL
jgi:hypothetical protein